MTAYYNEIDPYAAQWLRNLIAAGHIAPGDVDERSIRDVKPDELRGYTQCHFFAGIGVWSYALRRAGWPDDVPVWTGSCPCQPFSAAGKGAGFADDRHLWPDWFKLIAACVPRHIFGEQVASKDGLAWLDLVHADLEGARYTVRAADTCAAGFGAPHIRQRLYFVADATSGGRQSCAGDEGIRAPHDGSGTAAVVTGAQSPSGKLADAGSERRQQIGRGASGDEAAHGGAGRIGREPDSDHIAGGDGEARELADANGRDARAEGLQRGGKHGLEPQDGGAGFVGNPFGSGLEKQRRDGGLPRSQVESPAGEGAERAGTPTCENQDAAWNSDGKTRVQPGQMRERFPTNGFWSDADWLPCIDGKARPVEPGTFPLAHGAPARVGRLRAYGNAINAEQARNFIEACDLL